MTDSPEYLRSIVAVREKSKLVLQKLLANQLTNFDVEMSKMGDVAAYVASLIERDYGTNFASIPPHGRWQHFEVGSKPRLTDLIDSWSGVDKEEQTKRLIDLFTVSVLLDAGAGTQWSYTEFDGTVTNRSEGLAVASLDMFRAGMFSSNVGSNPHQVDSKALKQLTEDDLARGLQVSPDNPMHGLEGRASLLIRLGKALENEKYFNANSYRPGDMLDYLIDHGHSTGATSGSSASDQTGTATTAVDLITLWDVLMTGLSPIWPESRTSLNGISLGDAWPLSCIGMAIVPFHKLTQWLCYSLTVPIKRIMGLEFVNEHLQTGLPEYRNGGLFVDMGLLTLKPDVSTSASESFAPDSDVIVEWRAATVALLDLLLDEVNEKLHSNLSLPQLLEAGSWKAGRELAAAKRPDTKDPPIQIVSDGTLF